VFPEGTNDDNTKVALNSSAGTKVALPLRNSFKPAAEVAQAALAQLLGRAPQTVVILSGPLFAFPESVANTKFIAVDHPLAIAQNLTIHDVKSLERVLDPSHFPLAFRTRHLLL
jgi:hypothetical protein